MYLKIHETEKGAIVAMCDEKLLGRELREGKRELDLKRYAGFYKGDLVSAGAAEAAISGEEIYTANAVGSESVSVFISRGMASEAEVATVEGIPFLQLYKTL